MSYVLINVVLEAFVLKNHSVKPPVEDSRIQNEKFWVSCGDSVCGLLHFEYADE